MAMNSCIVMVWVSSKGMCPAQLRHHAPQSPALCAGSDQVAPLSQVQNCRTTPAVHQRSSWLDASLRPAQP